ncbi:hybrid sensor histidine kinase/response regulator [Maridesulfovibrio sp.]|uniref:hybrid sensor histidine kinase/response regulator n=1 Tax=Maridesulfovibrio sp. TaxID=2795000 RepID=UPI003BAB36EF
MNTEPKRHNILVVDDTEENIDILLETLDEDYDVSVALNGIDALEVIEEEKPDLILLDIMMPEMDGYEVCQRLKEDAATRDIPVIFITALTEAGNETKGLELGAIDYITKPFNPSIVKARVKNHLALRQAIKLREDVERMTRHDLKNPLQDILSLPQLMEMTGDNLTESQLDMLSRIEAAGKNMLRLINSSLDLFKMEQGRYTLHPEEVDLMMVVNECVREVETITTSKNIGLKLNVDNVEYDGAQNILVQGEKLLIYSMVANLLRNALDASPEDEAIHISIESGNPAKLKMRNKGAVPLAIRDMFFEKYATAGKHHGTGIGTYSARLIAQVHEGDIGFTVSDEQNETELWVKLPT